MRTANLKSANLKLLLQSLNYYITGSTNATRVSHRDNYWAIIFSHSIVTTLSFSHTVYTFTQSPGLTHWHLKYYVIFALQLCEYIIIVSTYQRLIRNGYSTSITHDKFRIYILNFLFVNAFNNINTINIYMTYCK